MDLTTSEVYFNASLSCIDLAHVAKSMEEINSSHIKSLHYDVVDGVFNSCFIFGDLMLKVFRSLSDLPITAHLACRNPIPYLKPIIQNGADYIAVHYEADIDILEVFKEIRSLGSKPVLAFRCDSEVPTDFIEVATQAEWILKLCVHPGFSGQPFYDKALDHIRCMHHQLSQAGLSKVIEADGNINTTTINACFKAGATMFTGGTSGLFRNPYTIDENIRLLKKAICTGGNLHGNRNE